MNYFSVHNHQIFKATRREECGARLSSLFCLFVNMWVGIHSITVTPRELDLHSLNMTGRLRLIKNTVWGLCLNTILRF